MSKSIHKLIDEQIKRWDLDKKEAIPIQQSIDVVTISRECGSHGYEVAKLLSEKTGFDLFHHEIVDAMVEESKTSRALLNTLDEAMNVVDDVVSNFVNEHHLWPDEYSKLLFTILSTIRKHGKAIILGRGANCVLCDQNVLRVRIVSPISVRRQYTQGKLELNLDDAQKYIVSKDANRSAFVKRYFNGDVADSTNYDLILNTNTIGVQKTVQIIQCAL